MYPSYQLKMKKVITYISYIKYKIILSFRQYSKSSRGRVSVHPYRNRLERIGVDKYYYTRYVSDHNFELNPIYKDFFRHVVLSRFFGKNVTQTYEVECHIIKRLRS